jgi:hypothetical protein
MNEKDLDSVIDAWSKDGEKFTLEGGIFRGKTELRSYHLGLFNNPFRNTMYESIIQTIRLMDSKNAILDGVWKTYDRRVRPRGTERQTLSLMNYTDGDHGFYSRS